MIVKGMSSKVLTYFAYGANMSAEHLKDLGIKWDKAHCAYISDYELAFNKISRDGTKTYANIQPKEGEFVYGILYEGINQEDLDKISHKEGVKQGHYSLKVLLVHKGEERTLYISSIIDAYVYIATGKSITTNKSIKPNKGYLDKLWEGRDYLPIEYRNKLLQTELKEGNKYLDQLELDKRCGYSRMKKERLKEIKELTKKALSLLKKPLTLEEARDIISKEEFNRFYRSEEIQKKYDLEKEEAVKRLKEDLNKIKQKNTNYRWILRKNAYPYYFEEELEHWVLWDMSTLYSDPWDRLKDDWELWKKNQFVKKKGEWVVSWINPPESCSVKDIPHVHLVKKTN